MTTLVIVESPGKIKKISSILGSGFKVVASVGHVRDLPGNELGVDPADFSPSYVPTQRGREVLARLRKDVAAADRVLLATDPDREGEAIAWHLADALRIGEPERITFTAITQEKIQEALRQVRGIDQDRVRAQEARRVLDRLVGYKVSPALSQRAGHALSAGRVQSPAVRLVVDREREIQNFKPVQHYGVELLFPVEGQWPDNPKALWRAQWDIRPHLAQGETLLLDRTLAERVATVRQVRVERFETGSAARAPAAPFTTSTLQQEAGKRLKMKPKRVMDLAQKLYEQGAITYHRTDNPNLDPAGVEAIRAYAQSQGLAFSEKLRTWKAKEGAQEGHEAIRPAHVEVLQAGADADQRALYELIWRRAVASQLADARYAVRAVLLVGEVQGTSVRFIGKGRKLTDPGWMRVYGAEVADDDQARDKEAPNPIPALQVGAALTAVDARVQDKVTEPPSRFKQSTLVAELERRGIGRPSTYAAILENITSRSYILEDPKGWLTPSPTGEAIRDALVGTFEFANLDYTRELEDQLDRIAERKLSYEAVIAQAWQRLDQELGGLGASQVAMPAAEHFPCPVCGAALRRRKGSKGFFWGCSAYPECKTTLPDEKGRPGKRRESSSRSPNAGKPAPALSEHACPDCGKPLVRRTGTSKGGKAYDFWACSGFPACKAAFENDNGRPGQAARKGKG
ncbi:type I DNA topoisomerase [Azotobacter vinelandii]|uniref:type I DNA topoisomerase n=1 Tax=Azotobacter vinelandii TaxID=354 RepID=UPI0007731313|nr:type I DNA topoisomerase [Azotobacter vinelandii]